MPIPPVSQCRNRQTANRRPGKISRDERQKGPDMQGPDPEDRESMQNEAREPVERSSSSS